jgi:hypothetical protein
MLPPLCHSLAAGRSVQHGKLSGHTETIAGWSAVECHRHSLKHKQSKSVTSATRIWRAERSSHIEPSPMQRRYGMRFCIQKKIPALDPESVNKEASMD